MGAAGGCEAVRVAVGAVGATLFGLISVLPTKVTPSSMTSLAPRMSPKSSDLALISILSLAMMLPFILPRTMTVPTLTLPLTMAESPRCRVPSAWISPSSLPSKVSSPANLRLPLISTSELRTFLTELLVLIAGSITRAAFKRDQGRSKSEASRRVNREACFFVSVRGPSTVQHLHRLFRVGHAEHEQPLAGIGWGGAVGVFDVHPGVRQPVANARQRTGLVVASDHQHLVFNDERPVVLEQEQRLARVAHDDSDDAMIDRVAGRDRVDVDFGGA